MITLRKFAAWNNTPFSINKGEYKLFADHFVSMIFDEVIASITQTNDGCHVITCKGSHIHFIPF